jgi:hypothetical protein
VNSYLAVPLTFGPKPFVPLCLPFQYFLQPFQRLFSRWFYQQTTTDGSTFNKELIPVFVPFQNIFFNSAIACGLE